MSASHEEDNTCKVLADPVVDTQSQDGVGEQVFFESERLNDSSYLTELVRWRMDIILLDATAAAT